MAKKNKNKNKNKNNNKKNKKNKKKNPKTPLPTAESIPDPPPLTVKLISITPPSPQSMVNPSSDSPRSPPSPPSPLSPRTPLPPVFFKNTVFTKSGDMNYKMRYEVLDIVDNAFKKHRLKDKDAAGEIKKELDKKHGPHWHCFIGASYGSYATYKTKRHFYFYMGGKWVLLFKHG